MKNTPILVRNENGFALITAIMMLFAATVMGLMVMNSSEIEILLSGAQQRYENNFNTVDGAASFEAAAVGKVATIRKGEAGERSYTVVDPSAHNSILSPKSPATPAFDPGGDMTIPDDAEDVDTTTDPNQWATGNLIQSNLAADNTLDYQYRTIFVGSGTTVPKGFSAEKFTNYQFEISASRTTLIEIGGNKIGPKITL